jgi:hypothetical protein
MLGEAIAVTAIGATVVTILDHENVFGQNPEKKFWWERPPFTPLAATARSTFPTPIRTMTPEQKIKMAQAQMANGQRAIAEATKEQMQQSYYIPGQLGKYSLSEQWSQSFPEPVRKPQGVRAL